MSLILGARDLSVHFPGTRALDGVSIELHEGEVHAIVGANGSGKTTLLSVVCGLMHPTHGELYDARGAVSFRSPAQALRLGIALVPQEPQLAGTLSCWENVVLGRESFYGITLGRRRGHAARRALQTALPHIDPREPVGTLRKGDKAIVALVAALARRPRLLALDEPTAVLGEQGVEIVSSAVAQVRDDGGGVVLVSHRLRDVIQLATEVSVLVDGRITHHGGTADLTADALVAKLMHGRTDSVLTETTHGVTMRSLRRNVATLTVSQLETDDGLAITDLEVQPTEIVGLAGLGGSGRSRLLRILAGVGRVRSGEVILQGKQMRLDPRAARRAGVAYIPEDRLAEGIFSTLTVARNLSADDLALSRSFLRFVSAREENVLASELISRFSIRTPAVKAPVMALSGGNLQRVLLARALARNPALLIADEPTQGVDSNGRLGIHSMLKGFADGGGAVVLASSDFDELLTLCTRILVLRDGRIVAHVAPSEADYRSLVSLASGVAPGLVSASDRGA